MGGRRTLIGLVWLRRLVSISDVVRVVLLKIKVWFGLSCCAHRFYSGEK